VLATALALTALAPAMPAASETIGQSVQGRPIRARRIGNPRAKRKVLVIGAIHGSELAGMAVTRRLRRARAPRGVEYWLIDDVNPDGSRARTRQNSRGVDLNRNFPYRWRGGGMPGDTYYPGPRALSEPESAAVARLIRRIKPRVTIWYHQQMRLVDRSDGDTKLSRLYARRARLPHREIGFLPGTATSWQARTVRGSTPFVVELPAGRLSSASVRRHARAVGSVARAIAPPRVRQRPIPFGAKRKRDMAAYSRRHYGIDSYRLRKPRVIVQHFTAGDSFQSAFNTFAPNRPDPELNELPGTCAHYVIAKNGAIYQLVSTRIMCRHTVGLNYTSIGIVHVGRSDGQVMGNSRQRRASLRLTRLLQGRFGIRTRNVIGHNENRSSPYHRERVARLRNQTHGDFRRSTMRRYRRLLNRLPAPSSMR
jgi:N-acetylmuramoyl-L-alanine amidase